MGWEYTLMVQNSVCPSLILSSFGRQVKLSRMDGREKVGGLRSTGFSYLVRFCVRDERRERDASDGRICVQEGIVNNWTMSLDIFPLVAPEVSGVDKCDIGG